MTGWKIDIEGTGEGLEEGTKEHKDVVEDDQTQKKAVDVLEEENKKQSAKKADEKKD